MSEELKAKEPNSTGCRGRLAESRRRQLQLCIATIGVILAVIGFSIHFAVPSETRSGSPIHLDVSDIVVDNIEFVRGDAEYVFKIYLDNYGFPNVSAYLLNSSEHHRFQLGTPLYELQPVVEFDDFSRTTWETTLSEDLDLYFVIVNNSTVGSICGYYYVIHPGIHYMTLTVGFAGLFAIISGLILYVDGWRRYFLLGLAVNLVLFYLRTFTLASDRLPFPDLFGIPFALDWFIEPYNDYQFFYLKWVPNLWDGVWPYSVNTSSRMVDYIYPPLWLYTVGAFGASPSWLPGMVLFLFNVATGVIVFGILYELTDDERRSIFAMMLYLFNPFTLFYGSFLWLNPTPYVFFVTLSFYLALKRQASASIIMIAIATLYKQFAIVFFPLLVLFLIKQDGDKSIREYVSGFLKHVTIYAIIIGLASIPFLIVDSGAYIGSVLRGGYAPEYLATFHPQPSWPMSFNTFFLWIGVPEGITWAIAYLLAYYVLLIIPMISIYFLYARYRATETNEIRSNALEAIFWSILIVLIVQTFYPRGTYKFYLLALTPFIALLFDYRDLDVNQNGLFQYKRRHLMPVLASILVFLCFRLVYFWILLIWVFFYLWKSNRLTHITQRGPRSQITNM